MNASSLVARRSRPSLWRAQRSASDSRSGVFSRFEAPSWSVDGWILWSYLSCRIKQFQVFKGFWDMRLLNITLHLQDQTRSTKDEVYTYVHACLQICIHVWKQIFICNYVCYVCMCILCWYSIKKTTTDYLKWFRASCFIRNFPQDSPAQACAHELQRTRTCDVRRTPRAPSFSDAERKNSGRMNQRLTGKYWESGTNHCFSSAYHFVISITHPRLQG